MADVRLENVTKIFPPAVVAVDDVSIHIHDKEFVVLVGPSGCGKSTTLRMIAGLEEVSGGNIYIGDTLVNDVPPKNRDIAMVFQNYALYPHMTVYNNMAFGLKLRKFPKKTIRDRVNEAAEILGIKELLDRKPKALSGGQRQRVAVGRAIVRKPRVFLFDEPLSNLDAKLRVQMRAELSKLHTQLESTMIYVTHDQTEAMTMGNRIVVMNDGIVQQIDTPLNLYGTPRNLFVAGFIGSPPMNFLDGILERGDDGLRFNKGSSSVRLPDSIGKVLASHEGKSIRFGVRPEDIVDRTDSARSATDSTIKARVEVVEPVGSEIYMYLAMSGQSLVARMSAEHTGRVGQDLDLGFRMDKVHFFDSNTGATLV